MHNITEENKWWQMDYISDDKYTGIHMVKMLFNVLPISLKDSMIIYSAWKLRESLDYQHPCREKYNMMLNDMSLFISNLVLDATNGGINER